MDESASKHQRRCQSCCETHNSHDKLPGCIIFPLTARVDIESAPAAKPQSPSAGQLLPADLNRSNQDTPLQRAGSSRLAYASAHARRPGSRYLRTTSLVCERLAFASMTTTWSPPVVAPRHASRHARICYEDPGKVCCRTPAARARPGCHRCISDTCDKCDDRSPYPLSSQYASAVIRSTPSKMATIVIHRLFGRTDSNDVRA